MQRCSIVTTRICTKREVTTLAAVVLLSTIHAVLQGLTFGMQGLKLILSSLQVVLEALAC